MSDEQKRDRLSEVISDAVVRLREFNRMASQDCEPDDFSDADVSYGLREVYGEPPEGTSDSWLLADVGLVCAAYEMMRCERDALLRKQVAELSAENKELRTLSKNLAVQLRTNTRNTST